MSIDPETQVQDAQVQDAREQMMALAAYLTSRHDAILLSWREMAEADAALATASTLSRVQFNDHIPDVLNGLVRRLEMWRDTETSTSQRDSDEATTEEGKDAAEHGLHRWQQGYNLRELTREWGHLQMCLSEELDAFHFAHRDVQPEVMAAAHRETVRLCIEGISESVAQYARLQQAEAAGHARDLKESLDQLNDLERRRAETLREAAHDLRGNLSVVSGATSMLQRENMPDRVREEFLSLLQNGVSSLHAMLNDLMDLARLQAGHETRKIASFDAAPLLGELCASSQALAEERGLYLRCDGPDELQVEGDQVKVRRIAQNLLLNALKYTPKGGVTLSWSERDAERWVMCVCDTGPGLNLGSSAPLAQNLQSATATAREVEIDSKNDPTKEPGRPSPDIAPIALVQAASVPDVSVQDNLDKAREPGEGIGISIVKRLCELLDAGLELDSQVGKGSTFHVVMPRLYDQSKDATQ